MVGGLMPKQNLRARRNLILAASAVLLPAPIVWADTIWTAGTGDYSISSNWSAGVPSGLKPGEINNGGTAQILSGFLFASTLYLGMTATQSGAMAIFPNAQLDVEGAQNNNTASFGNVFVGYGGTGTFTQTGGAVFGSLALFLGYSSGSIGNYNLSGTSIFVGLNATEFVGYSGNGNFIQSGMTNNATNLTIGYNGVGTYQLSGGTLAIGTSAFIAENAGSTGSFIQSGGFITGGSEYLGFNPGSHGSFILSEGTISLQNEFVGSQGMNGNILPPSGTGTFIQTGGKNHVVTLAPGGGGLGSYWLQGGLLQAIGINYYDGSSFSQSGGTLSFENFNQFGGTVTAGGVNSTLLNPLVLGGINGFQPPPGIGSAPSSYNLGGGLLSSPSVTINSGTFRYTAGSLSCEVINQNGGFVDWPQIDLAGQDVPLYQFVPNLTYNYTSGMFFPNVEYVGNSLSGAYAQTFGANAMNTLYVGFAAGITGTYTLSSSAGLGGPGVEEFMGYSGTGALVQSGGNNQTSELQLGYNFGSFGSYMLSGAGTVTASSVNVGISGAGNFNQSGGLAKITGGLSIGDEPGGGSGIYTLSGMGTVSATSIEAIGGFSSGMFNQSGGLNKLASSLFVSNLGTYLQSGGSLAVTGSEDINGGLFSQSGGTNNPQTLSINQGGSYTLSATGTLIAGTLSLSGSASDAGLFIQSGGAAQCSSLNILGTSTYSLSAGTLTVTYFEQLNGIAPVTFSQSGGLNSVGSLALGQSIGTIGCYSLTGGTLAVKGTEFVGDGPGVGTFIQSGGLNTAAAIMIATIASNDIGSYSLTGGSISVSGALTVSSSSGGTASLTVAGATVSAGSVVNHGDIALNGPIFNIPAGDLDALGNYSQSVIGELDIGLGGPTPGNQYATLIALGTASLAGTLSVSLSNGFFPSLGDVFDIITASAVNGTFANVNLPGGKNLFSLSYTPTAVVLTAIPEPASVGLLAISAAALLARRRRQ
jgi:hypothetical protein